MPVVLVWWYLLPLPRRTEVNYPPLFSIPLPPLCSVMVLVMIWMILLVWHEPLSPTQSDFLWARELLYVGFLLEPSNNLGLELNIGPDLSSPTTLSSSSGRGSGWPWTFGRTGGGQ